MMVALYIFLLLSIASQTFSQTSFITAPPPNINQQQYFYSNNVIENAVPNYSGNKLASRAMQKPMPNYIGNQLASGAVQKPITNNGGNQLASSVMQKQIPNNGHGPMDETDVNSSFMSQFAAYNLEAQKEAGIYPRLFDITFPPEDISENFYNEVVYFALELGLYEVGSLPRRVADAAVQAISKSTPLQFFKIISNTLELALEHKGILTEGNYKVLARINAKALEDAMDLLKVDDARSAFHAIIVGAGTFFKILSVTDPNDIEFIIATLADQLSKVNSAPVSY